MICPIKLVEDYSPPYGRKRGLRLRDSSWAAIGSCSREEYRFPRSRKRSLAIFSVETTTWFRPNILRRKIGPYSSAQLLNLSQE